MRLLLYFKRTVLLCKKDFNCDFDTFRVLNCKLYVFSATFNFTCCILCHIATLCIICWAFTSFCVELYYVQYHIVTCVKFTSYFVLCFIYTHCNNFPSPFVCLHCFICIYLCLLDHSAYWILLIGSLCLLDHSELFTREL